jgi:hypothetical protein
VRDRSAPPPSLAEVRAATVPIPGGGHGQQRWRAVELLAGFSSYCSVASHPHCPGLVGFVSRSSLTGTICAERAGYATSQELNAVAPPTKGMCDFIDQSLTEHGIDIAVLTARHGLDRYQIMDKWQKW